MMDKLLAVDVGYRLYVGHTQRKRVCTYLDTVVSKTARTKQ